MLIGSKLSEILNDNRSRKDLVYSVENLVDLIYYKIQKNSVSDSFESLKSQILDLRFKIINDPEVLSEYFEEENWTYIIEEIYSRPPVDNELEYYLAKGLEIYQKVVTTYIENIDDEDELYEEALNFDAHTFFSVINLLPTTQRKDILNALFSSLFIDFYMIVTDAYLENKIDLNAQKINDLKELFKLNIENFALFNYKTGLWEPDDEDETPWVRNIKILIAREQVRENSNKLTLEQARELFS